MSSLTFIITCYILHNLSSVYVLQCHLLASIVVSRLSTMPTISAFYMYVLKVILYGEHFVNGSIVPM